MLRTRVRIRSAFPTDSYSYADAIASIRIAGYTLLIHKSPANTERFSVTYAPLGFQLLSQQASIDSIVPTLDRYIDNIPRVIEERRTEFTSENIPDLGPEEGIQSNDWRYREEFRFESGEYQHVPSVLGLEYPKGDYLHLSTTKTESDFVAYTPTDSYGERDRQVRLKFGKYLKRTFEHLSDSEIQEAVTKLRAKLALAETPATICFTTERDQISEIFETQMCACDSISVSCMHGKFSTWEHRPYWVYADSPDVAVAYLLEHGEITARTVVSTKDKEWIRFYAIGGCSTKCGILENLLVKEGYSEGDLNGNRLTKVKGNLMPYLDCGDHDVDDRGDYWVVCEEGEGEYSAAETGGHCGEREPTCDGCDCAEDECECPYCDCCEERIAGGCERCSICPRCDSCIEHNACECERCSSCEDLLSDGRRHHYDTCDCPRCSNCNELDSDCDCEKCEDCDELIGECDCEKETENETESETDGDVEVSTASTI